MCGCQDVSSLSMMTTTDMTRLETTSSCPLWSGALVTTERWCALGVQGRRASEVSRVAVWLGAFERSVGHLMIRTIFSFIFVVTVHRSTAAPQFYHRRSYDSIDSNSTLPASAHNQQTMSPSSLPQRPLRIGMIGGGVVGGGVYEIIQSRLGASSSSNNNITPIITKICVRDASKQRDFHVDSSTTQIVTDTHSVIDDPEIDMVVEVMGGTTLAKEVVMQSLQNGKSVVTANKALIAECLEEIEGLVHKVNSGGEGRKHVKFAFEASVCGGIPIIHTLQSCYKGDIINEGEHEILNADVETSSLEISYCLLSTFTNYILIIWCQ